MSLAVSVGDDDVRRLELTVPWVGVWTARVSMVEDVQLSGSVTLKIGDSSWSGTIVEGQRFAARGHYEIRGGSAGWRKELKAKGYHNDAGVQRKTVAQDAASEAGERIQIDAAANGKMGLDYAREPGLASRVLYALWPSTPWWVDADGLTHVGERSTTDVSDDVELIDVPAAHWALVRFEDVTKVLPGCSITDERAPDGAIVIRDSYITIDTNGSWCDAFFGPSSLGESVRKLARDPLKTYLGVYRYRVVQMKSQRVTLQALKSGPKLPDLDPVSQVPGLAGSSSTLTAGGVVYLSFADGDPSYPIIVGYAKSDDSAHKPQTTVIDVTERLELGESASTVKIAGGSQKCSRSDRCNNRFAALESFAASHLHSGGTISGFTGVASGAPSGSSVACDKVDIT